MNSITFNGKEYVIHTEKMEKILEASSCYILIYHHKENLLIASESFAKLFNTPMVMENIPESLKIDFIHPDFFDELDEIYKHIVGGEESYSVLLRTRANPIYSRVTFTNIDFDESGKPKRAIGIVQVVDEHIQKEKEYNRQLQEFMNRQIKDTAIMRALSIEYESVYHLDIVNNIVTPIRLSDLIEKQYGQFFRSKPTYEKAFGAYVEKTVYEDDKEMLLKAGDIETIKRELSDKNIYEQEYRVKRDGVVRYYNMKVVRNDNGDKIIKGVVFGFADVNDQKIRWERLISNSLTDELTGVGNRRAYDNAINELNNEVPEEGIGFISIDANGLKGINDNLGHAAGDEMLCGVAKCLTDAFGIKNVFRMGGDEFYVICADSKESIEHKILDFNNRLFLWRGMMVKSADVSLGLAYSSDYPGLTPITLSRYADDAMYKDKAEYYNSRKEKRR